MLVACAARVRTDASSGGVAQPVATMAVRNDRSQRTDAGIGLHLLVADDLQCLDGAANRRQSHLPFAECGGRQVGQMRVGKCDGPRGAACIFVLPHAIALLQEFGAFVSELRDPMQRGLQFRGAFGVASERVGDAVGFAYGARVRVGQSRIGGVRRTRRIDERAAHFRPRRVAGSARGSEGVGRRHIARSEQPVAFEHRRGELRVDVRDARLDAIALLRVFVEPALRVVDRRVEHRTRMRGPGRIVEPDRAQRCRDGTFARGDRRGQCVEAAERRVAAVHLGERAAQRRARFGRGEGRRVGFRVVGREAFERVAMLFERAVRIDDASEPCLDVGTCGGRGRAIDHDRRVGRRIDLPGEHGDARIARLHVSGSAGEGGAMRLDGLDGGAEASDCRRGGEHAGIRMQRREMLAQAVRFDGSSVRAKTCGGQRGVGRGPRGRGIGGQQRHVGERCEQCRGVVVRTQQRRDGAAFLDGQALRVKLRALRFERGELVLCGLQRARQFGPVARSYRRLAEGGLLFLIRQQRLVDARLASARAGHVEGARFLIELREHRRDAAHAGTRLEQCGAHFAFALQQRLAAGAQARVVEAEHRVVFLARESAGQQRDEVGRGRTVVGRWIGVEPERSRACCRDPCVA